MFRIYQTAVLLCTLVPGPMLTQDQNKNQQKDPPTRYEGVVSAVDKANPNAVSLTIMVKEMQPTDKEDVVVPVEKLYEFKMDRAAKIIGLDGKPDKAGLKSLVRGTKVRVETKAKAEKVAVEVKILPTT